MRNYFLDILYIFYPSFPNIEKSTLFIKVQIMKGRKDDLQLGKVFLYIYIFFK